MSFVIKAYNVSTGHVETVSDPIPDEFIHEGWRKDWRAFYADDFAAADTSDSHVYYAVTLEVESNAHPPLV